MCRKFTYIFTTNFVGSLDIRASREVFPIEIRSPEIRNKSQFSKFDKLVKSQFYALASFRRKPESSNINTFWMPDQVRHDDLRTFYETIKFIINRFRVFVLS
jgi:hypothetical protein